jgi:ribosomal protein S14
VALHVTPGSVTGDSSDDLLDWLRGLTGCPPVTHTVLATCNRHGDEQPTWSYVEADASAGVARRRCIACGGASALLDSAERWTFPPMWSCRSCAQSLAEVAAAVSTTSDDTSRATWLALAARCVECGRIEGLTDVLVPGLPLDEVTAQL